MGSRSADGEYPAAFRRLWAIYPKRARSNPKRRTFAAWRARLEEGAEANHILDGARAYARFCSETGKLNTEYVFGGRRRSAIPRSSLNDLARHESPGVQFLGDARELPPTGA